MAARVLIVDDDALSREVLRFLLEQAGFDVFIHPSAEKITGAMIRALRPALILCGLDLPGVAPERFAPLIQNLRGSLGVKTILISNLAPHQIAERAQVVGADGWFEKSRLIFDPKGAVEEALAKINAPARAPAPTAPEVDDELDISVVGVPTATAPAAQELVSKIGAELRGFEAARAEPRAKADVPCKGACGGHAFQGRIVDISASGLFVATAAAFPTGSRATVDFQLPGSPPIRAETTVVWQRGDERQPVGLGLKFAFLIPEDREVVERFVAQVVPELFE